MPILTGSASSRRGYRGFDGSTGCFEGRAHPIAGVLEQSAAVTLDGFA
jgi:hypothetical protein